MARDMSGVVYRVEQSGHGCAGGSDLVHAFWDGGALVRQRDRAAVAVGWAQRLVDFDERAIR